MAFSRQSIMRISAQKPSKKSAFLTVFRGFLSFG